MIRVHRKTRPTSDGTLESESTGMWSRIPVVSTAPATCTDEAGSWAACGVVPAPPVVSAGAAEKAAAASARTPAGIAARVVREARDRICIVSSFAERGVSTGDRAGRGP